MTPTSFKEVNQVYGAGGNPNTDQLPVAISTCDSTPEVPFVVSKWKPTPEELKLINERGEIWVAVMGTQLPPMAVVGYNPFTELDYKPIKLQ